MYRQVETELLRLESDLAEWYAQPVDIQLLNKLEGILWEVYQKGYNRCERDQI